MHVLKKLRISYKDTNMRARCFCPVLLSIYIDGHTDAWHDMDLGQGHNQMVVGLEPA